MTSTDDTLAQQVLRVVDVLRGALEAEDVSVVLLDREGALRLVGASGATARALERAQEGRQEGPGFDALRTGAPVAVADLHESDWAGVIDVPQQAHGLLCVPIVVGGVVAGNVNVVAERRRSWSDDDIHRAEAAAAAVASLLQVAAAVETSGVAASAVEVLGGLAGDGQGSDR